MPIDGSSPELNQTPATISASRLRAARTKINERIEKEDRIKMRLGGDPDSDPIRYKVHNAVEKIKLENIDPLTGLSTKRSFEIEELKRIAKVNESPDFPPLEGNMFDVDDFGKVNKELGQSTGDRVLKAIGKKILSIVRESDYAGRLGGEELGLLSNRTGFGLSSDDTPLPAERIRSGIENLDMDIGRKVTVSVGTTLYRKGETLDQYKKRLETALILAKRLGKNRVVEGLGSMSGHDTYKDWTTGIYYEVFKGEHGEFLDYREIEKAA